MTLWHKIFIGVGVAGLELAKMRWGYGWSFGWLRRKWGGR
jgi:hypothetical protein